MKILNNENLIVDSRGFIQDLASETQINTVTQIFSHANSIRANHYHKLTEQYNYVAKGSLILAVRDNINSPITYTNFKEGDFFLIEKNEHHAIRFLDESLLLVMTIGPRGGKDYETDTYRLDTAPLFIADK